MRKSLRGIAVLLALLMLIPTLGYASSSEKSLSDELVAQERTAALRIAVLDNDKRYLSGYVTNDNLEYEVVIDGVYHGIFRAEGLMTYVVLSEEQLDEVQLKSRNIASINGEEYSFNYSTESWSNGIGDIVPMAGWTQIYYNPSNSWSLIGSETVYPHIERSQWNRTVGVIGLLLSASVGLLIPAAGAMIAVAAFILTEIDNRGYPPSATKINLTKYSSGVLFRKSNLHCYASWGSGYKYLGLEVHYFSKSIGGP